MPRFSERLRAVTKLMKGSDNHKVEWTAEHEAAVRDIADYLQENCFLKLPNYDRPFYVATDWSGVGIGAVLM